MKTICIDTSHRHLVLVLLDNQKVVASYCEEAWKRQSETVFVELIALLDKQAWKVDDIDEMVITKGPGSYTGIRIAMSIAKVLCTRKPITLYTISTLQLYAGLLDTYVLLDARSNRAYFANYKEGSKIEECIKTIDELQGMHDKNFVGDIDLLGKEKVAVPFVENFANLYSLYEKVDNVHTLTPEYLKDESAYL